MAVSDPTVISGLREVADRYGALLCDIWGVVHNGEERFAEACQALLHFNATRGPVVLISNSPRPAQDVDEQLQALDVPAAAYAAIVTSGDVTRQFLAERQHQRVWIVGPDRDSGLYQGLTLTPSALQAAQFISCTGLFDDEVETPEDYRERLQWAQEQDLEMICANPDRVVQRGGRLIYCAGALSGAWGKNAHGGQAVRPDLRPSLSRSRPALRREGSVADVGGGRRAPHRRSRRQRPRP
jgi:HAD superfamily hydrolase (TIGR01459 family)